MTEQVRCDRVIGSLFGDEKPSRQVERKTGAAQDGESDEGHRTIVGSTPK